MFTEKFLEEYIEAFHDEELVYFSSGDFKTLYETSNENVLFGVLDFYKYVDFENDYSCEEELYNIRQTLGTAKYLKCMFDHGHMKGIYFEDDNYFYYLIEKVSQYAPVPVSDISGIFYWIFNEDNKPTFADRYQEVVEFFTAIKNNLRKGEIVTSDIAFRNIGCDSEGNVKLFDVAMIFPSVMETWEFLGEL